MKVFLHSCCGPCTLYPLSWLRDQGHQVEAWFHNPNIHPYREFKRRIQALRQVAENGNLPLTVDNNYGLRDFLRQVVFHEEGRCRLCYGMRLEAAARAAKAAGADGYTTTLLYSRYQNHEQIKQLGEEFGRMFAIPFLYHDFREGWQQGIDRAVELDIYRQPYCGCIYSEQERYDKKLRKKGRKVVEKKANP
ncbi:MAG: epoxyqueuosine reductase QueH [Thermodesulfobacteriota bacterium]